MLIMSIGGADHLMKMTDEARQCFDKIIGDKELISALGMEVVSCPRCFAPSIRSEDLLFCKDEIAYRCGNCGDFGYKDGSWWELNPDK